MNPRRTLATTARVLTQLRRDPRTIGLLLVVPLVLLGLLAWVFADQPRTFDRIGPALLGVFPHVVMFVVTSIATLRERSSGTLERLLSTPIGKADLLLGYALAFGLVATVQGVLAAAWAVYVCGLDIAGSVPTLVLVAVSVALLGLALGLLASAFARTEFQAVQFMPAFILPQFLLCGLLVPRDRLPRALSAISDWLPLSYAVDAMNEISTHTGTTATAWRSIGIVWGFILVALVLAALTLRRRTP